MSIMYHVITVLNKKIYITIETIKQQKFPFTNQQYASKDVTDLETLALTNKSCKKQYCKLKQARRLRRGLRNIRLIGLVD